MTSPMPSSSNMPATRPRWSKTWLRYTRWSGIIISSEGEGILQGLQGNIKMIQIIERDAESRRKAIGTLLGHGVPNHGGLDSGNLDLHPSHAARKRKFLDLLQDRLEDGIAIGGK